MVINHDVKRNGNKLGFDRILSNNKLAVPKRKSPHMSSTIPDTKQRITAVVGNAGLT